MKKVILTHPDDLYPLIHYEGAFDDHTLCGDAMEEDISSSTHPPIDTTKRVTCPRCIAVVKHVRGR